MGVGHMNDLEFKAPSYEEAYQKLRTSFMERLKTSIEAIDRFFEQAEKGPLLKDSLERAMHLAHGLAGSGTTFGFPEITSRGQKIDSFLMRVLKSLLPEQGLDEKDFETFEKLMIHLRTACAEGIENDVKVTALDQPSGVTPPSSNETKSDFCVLVVDDDGHLADFLSLKLRQKNIRVIVSLDGEKALKAIEREKPDLVILDIMMPGLSGHDVLRRLKQKAEFASIPVLMLTAQAQERDVVSALHSGAIDYIVKPVDTDQLVVRVEKILDASRYTVVIADNDPLILQLLDSKFRGRGFKVVLADDGKKAWDHVFKTLPDLVILDRMMPGLEGLAILQNIRNEKETKNIPVIILSARKEERDVKEGLKRGAQDYVCKPFMPDDLLSRSLKLLKSGHK